MAWIPNQPSPIQGHNHALQNTPMNNYAQASSPSSAYSSNNTMGNPNLQTLIGALTQLVSLLSQQMQPNAQQSYQNGTGYQANNGMMGQTSGYQGNAGMGGGAGMANNGMNGFAMMGQGQSMQSSDIPLSAQQTALLADQFNLGQATRIGITDMDNNGIINKGDFVTYEGEGVAAMGLDLPSPAGFPPASGGSIQLGDLDVQLLEGSETALNLSPDEAALVQQRFNLPSLNYRLIDTDKSGNLSKGDVLLPLDKSSGEPSHGINDSDVSVLNGQAKVFNPSAIQDLAIRDRFNLGPNDAYQLVDIGPNGTISNGDELLLADGSRAILNKYDVAVIDNLVMSTESAPLALSMGDQQMLQQQMNLPANERFIVMDRDQNGQLSKGDQLLNITPRGDGSNEQNTLPFDDSVDKGSKISFGSRVIAPDAGNVVSPHNPTGFPPENAGRPQIDPAILYHSPTLNLDANEMNTLIERANYVQPERVNAIQVYDVDNNGVINPGDALTINAKSPFPMPNGMTLPNQDIQKTITKGDVQALQGTIQRSTLTPQQEVNLQTPIGNALQFVNDLDYSNSLSLGDELVAVDPMGQTMYTAEVTHNTLLHANGLTPVQAPLGFGEMPSSNSAITAPSSHYPSF